MFEYENILVESLILRFKKKRVLSLFESFGQALKALVKL